MNEDITGEWWCPLLPASTRRGFTRWDFVLLHCRSSEVHAGAAATRRFCAIDMARRTNCTADDLDQESWCTDLCASLRHGSSRTEDGDDDNDPYRADRPSSHGVLKKKKRNRQNCAAKNCFVSVPNLGSAGAFVLGVAGHWSGMEQPARIVFCARINKQCVR
jgi:hypothetical protein